MTVSRVQYGLLRQTTSAVLFSITIVLLIMHPASKNNLKKLEEELIYWQYAIDVYMVFGVSRKALQNDLICIKYGWFIRNCTCIQYKFELTHYDFVNTYIVIEFDLHTPTPEPKMLLRSHTGSTLFVCRLSVCLGMT